MLVNYFYRCALFYYFVFKLKYLGIKRIVVTGAPGTGKTSLINSLEAVGYHCFHEIIRSMTAAAKNNPQSKPMVSNPLAFVDNPLRFNQTLLKGRLQHFNDAKKLTGDICFYDRGMPDVLAYMDFFEQEYGPDFVTPCQNHIYDVLFILPPWQKIYISDHERLETFEEAEKLHQHLMDTYRRFDYNPIMVPTGTVAERLNFVLDELNLKAGAKS